MRSLIVACLALSATGCNSWSLNSDLNGAYRAYDKGDCAQVMLDLSRAERRIRARPYLQPEISLLRGQCLERQSLFVDAAQTYHFIIAVTPPANMPTVPRRGWRPCASWAG
ncbi:putative lipoprotein [Pseudomonas aeruginosa]|nr:putative lipoprotein [Pseudomonas aeruginosa]